MLSVRCCNYLGIEGENPEYLGASSFFSLPGTQKWLNVSLGSYFDTSMRFCNCLPLPIWIFLYRIHTLNVVINVSGIKGLIQGIPLLWADSSGQHGVSALRLHILFLPSSQGS